MAARFIGVLRSLPARLLIWLPLAAYSGFRGWQTAQTQHDGTATFAYFVAAAFFLAMATGLPDPEPTSQAVDASTRGPRWAWLLASVCVVGSGFLLYQSLQLFPEVG